MHFIVPTPVEGGGAKNDQNGQKKINPLEIPIMMLNHQKNWIEVNLGAPGPGMIIFPNFSPKLCPRGRKNGQNGQKKI